MFYMAHYETQRSKRNNDKDNNNWDYWDLVYKVAEGSVKLNTFKKDNN